MRKTSHISLTLSAFSLSILCNEQQSVEGTLFMPYYCCAYEIKRNHSTLFWRWMFFSVLLFRVFSLSLSFSFSVCLQQSTMRTKSHRTQTTAQQQQQKHHHQEEEQRQQQQRQNIQSVYETSFHIFRLMLLIFSTRINPTFSERERLFAVYFENKFLIAFCFLVSLYFIL